MEEVEKFIKEHTRRCKKRYVTRKTLYGVFKVYINSIIKAKDFKEYCDEHLSVKTNFWATDRNNKKKLIRTAYEVEYELENKWWSEYEIKEKQTRALNVTGYLVNIKFGEKINILTLMNENGEKLGDFCSYRSEKNRVAINDCFMKKVDLIYYESEKFKNIFKMEEVKQLSSIDRNLIRKIKGYYTKKYWIEGRAMFGKIAEVEELTTEEKAELNAA